MKPGWLGLTAVAIVIWSNAAAATARVCVSVQQKSWYRPPPAPHVAGRTSPRPRRPPVRRHRRPCRRRIHHRLPRRRRRATRLRPNTPRRRTRSIRPLYLTRMLEYEVTHEPGFLAVAGGCQQHLVVELYQLESGWTVFARYADREEKVDHAQLDEFNELAQRLAFALLRHRTIGQTITRENVLRSDSERNLRTVEGSRHFIFGMGTEVRLAELPTAQGQSLPVADELRVLTPISIQAGYRYKLHSWGFDAFGRVGIGTEQTGVHDNDLGGHVDYSWSLSAGLHFLRYLDAPGINSLYFGGGAAFELAFFSVIRPVADRADNTARPLVGGGLNVDLLVGYEFLRASSIHFFGQVELDAPTYLLKTQNDAGASTPTCPARWLRSGSSSSHARDACPGGAAGLRRRRAHRAAGRRARAASDVRRDHVGAGADRYAGPAGARRDRPPPHPPRRHRDCQASLTIEVLDFGAGRQVDHGPAQHAGAAPRADRAGRVGAGRRAPADGPASQRPAGAARAGVDRAGSRGNSGRWWSAAPCTPGSRSTSWWRLSGRAGDVARRGALVAPRGRPDRHRRAGGGRLQPGAQPATLHLAPQFDAQVEAAFYFRPAESFSLFASALVGLVYQRFQGPATFDGPGVTGVATAAVWRLVCGRASRRCGPPTCAWSLSWISSPRPSPATIPITASSTSGRPARPWASACCFDAGGKNALSNVQPNG